MLWRRRWSGAVFAVVVVVAVVVVAGLNPRASASLRQAANDCDSASCCGHTEGSIGCRFQGNRCRCPFLVPSTLTIRPYGHRFYQYFERRRRPPKQEDGDRR